jgi:hypothetical protein
VVVRCHGAAPCSCWFSLRADPLRHPAGAGGLGPGGLDGAVVLAGLPNDRWSFGGCRGRPRGPRGRGRSGAGRCLGARCGQCDRWARQGGVEPIEGLSPVWRCSAPVTSSAAWSSSSWSRCRSRGVLARPVDGLVATPARQSPSRVE